MQDALTGFRIGHRLIGKEMIQFQMEGRKFLSLEKMQSPDINRFRFDEVLYTALALSCRKTGLPQELYIKELIPGPKVERPFPISSSLI